MKRFTPSTAPKNGRPKGSKNRLSRQAMEILDRLQADWIKHGPAVLKTLRMEQPQAYARLAVEVAARLTLADTAAMDAPMIVTVKWIDPKTSRMPPPLPPETAHPQSQPHPPPSPLPTMTPASSAKLLTFHRLSD